MHFPKLTLNIKLIGTNRISVDLSHVTVIYDTVNSDDYNKYVNVIHTENYWTIMVSTEFGIDISNKILSIPDRDNRKREEHNVILTFYNNEERYDFLKSLKNALIEWSGNKIFKNIHRFSPKPHIFYNFNKWTIY